ncbi:OmpH family outer membrane protein [Flavimarina sp. Hel_I_48]|uniref:OmpH family outer membrane protein n=1 Tax=Flavimarina sp. Hel_I_48 TaxID=1392488 RepID=UPI0004DF32A9|nr:OmpH family outer membrane protein [Flavimarina sp. Hel_I_48]
MIKYISLFLIAFALSFQAKAQSKEVAHINMNKLLDLMPEMQQAKAEIDRTERAYREDFQMSYREYQAKFQKLEEEKASLTPEQTAKRQSDLQLIERNLAQTQQNIDLQIKEKQDMLYKPIREKAIKIVDQVADAQGFFYVLDSSADAGIIMAKGKDLLADVKKMIGL